MLNVQFNPPGVQPEYLRGLNAGFGHWGDDRMFDWAFRRQLSFPATDLMIVTGEGGELLAGSGISYRRLEFPNGNAVTVGIMTGSWTLPAARRMSCFTRVIQESLQQTRARGGALLIAFVTEDNASARRLIAAGSALAPSHYLFTTTETPGPAGEKLMALLPDAATIARLRGLAGADGQFRFGYPTERDFVSQVLERPEPTTVVADAAGNMAVIETVGDTDRVQYLGLTDPAPDRVRAFVASLLAAALGRQRKMFLFTTRPEVAAAAQGLGMAHKPGYITLLSADPDLLQTAAGSSTPDDRFFIGTWQIHGGDRM